MKEQINYNDFDKVDIRLGTVISLEKNEKARKPSLVLKVDCGPEIGIKQSSAQITHFYNKENLVGKQVIGVVNFPEKNIAGIVTNQKIDDVYALFNKNNKKISTICNLENIDNPQISNGDLITLQLNEGVIYMGQIEDDEDAIDKYKYV